MGMRTRTRPGKYPPPSLMKTMTVLLSSMLGHVPCCRLPPRHHHPLLLPPAATTAPPLSPWPPPATSLLPPQPPPATSSPLPSTPHRPSATATHADDGGVTSSRVRGGYPPLKFLFLFLFYSGPVVPPPLPHNLAPLP